MYKLKKRKTNNSYEKTKKYVLNVVLIFLLGILSFRFFLPFCSPTKHKIENITFEEGSEIEEIKTFDLQFGDEAEEYYGTFEDCENLKQLVLPNSVKTVGKMALVGCKSLEY